MRLVSICPSNTELAVYTGLAEFLVGVDNYSDWPEETVRGLPRLGPDLSIDMDKVAALKPDLVFASLTVPGMEKNIEGLKEHGIPYVIVPNVKTLSEIGKQLIWLGEQTGKRQIGLEAHDRFYSWLEKYAKWSDKVTERKTVYWEWWGKPVFTPGKQNWLTELTELAGGTNIFADHDQASVKTNWQDVYERDPDVIGVIWVGVQRDKVQRKVIEKRPNWKEMSALVNNELHILDEPYFCRPSPRLLIGLMTIAAILHPTIYPAYSDGFDPMISKLDN